MKFFCIQNVLEWFLLLEFPSCLVCQLESALFHSSSTHSCGYRLIFVLQADDAAGRSWSASGQRPCWKLHHTDKLYTWVSFLGRSYSHSWETGLQSPYQEAKYIVCWASALVDLQLSLSHHSLNLVKKPFRIFWKARKDPILSQASLNSPCFIRPILPERTHPCRDCIYQTPNSTAFIDLSQRILPPINLNLTRNILALKNRHHLSYLS